MTSNETSTGQNLNEEQTVNLGTMAAEAMNNPIFKVVYDHLCAKYYQQWMNANEAHTKEMSFLKAKHMVLGEIMQDFHGLRQHAERILAERQEQNSQTYKDKQALDEQGFGLNFQGGVQ